MHKPETPHEVDRRYIQDKVQARTQDIEDITLDDDSTKTRRNDTRQVDHPMTSQGRMSRRHGTTRTVCKDKTRSRESDIS